jgi:hypothetical protein
MNKKSREENQAQLALLSLQTFSSLFLYSSAIRSGKFI